MLRRLRQITHNALVSKPNSPYSLTTEFLSVPTPSTLTSTTSPAASGPTPAGVPVGIKSPGNKRHRLRNMPNHNVQRKDEIPRVPLLPHLTIDTGFHAHSRPRINLIGHHRTDRTERVESLGPRPLPVFILKVARRDVIHARVSQNVLPDVGIRRRLVASLANHHPQLALMINPL